MTRSVAEVLATNFQPFQCGKLGCLGIKTPEAIALQNQGGSDVQQIVGAKAVTRGMPERKFFKLLFEFRRRNRHCAQELGVLRIAPKVCVGERRLLRRDKGLTRFAREKNVELKRVQDFDPMQPRQRQWS